MAGVPLARWLGGALVLASAWFQSTPAVIEGVPVQPVEYGDLVSSVLTPMHPVLADGSRGEVWMFPGAAGECVTIRLQTARFAPVLDVRYASPNGARVAYDDDGYLGWPSVVRLELPWTGTYFIVAGADESNAAAGEYQLAVEASPACSQATGAGSVRDG